MKIDECELLAAMERVDEAYLIEQVNNLRSALASAAAVNYTLTQKLKNRNRTIIHNGQKYRKLTQ